MDIKATSAEADQTFMEVLEVLESIPAEEINTVPFAGSWTAGQNAQHIILSAGGFVQLMNGPTKDTHRDPEKNCASLRELFLNFDIKMKSPDFIVPENEEYDKQQLLDALRDIQKSLLTAVQTLDFTQTCLLFELPNSGYITRAEAVTFTIVHTQRHVHQLKNIVKSLSLPIK